ncbi:MAG: recombinase family protein [Thermosipho sp. (in: Bacteria)]|nr:recombinase family protein [Thermosipho sp. (in: thermotogales)]
MAVVAIYSRKSKYTDKGESIKNQIELCKEYAEKHFNVDRFLIYEDEGYSGGHADRPNFQKMLKDISKKKFDILICYRLDRISRNITDFSDLVELLQENNVDFVSVREQFDTSTPMGRAMMYITSVFAQLERETIAERIRDNMHQLARTGRWLGGKTPTGFKSQPLYVNDKEKGKKKMYKLSPIPKELELVKTLYYKFLELGSLTRLESWTLENNVKTKNNKNFDKSILKIILTNPVYVIADELIYEYFKKNDSDIASNKEEFDGIHGLMVFNKHDEKRNRVIRNDKSKWIVAVGKHKGIIPSQDWIRVQNILEKNREKAPRAGTGKVGLITNLLRCKNCGSKMRVSVYRRKSGIYYYYKCLLKERSKGSRCNIRNLNGSLADEYVINEIKKINYKESDVYKHLYEMKEKLRRESSNQVSEKEMLEKELLEYKKAIKNLTLQLSQNKDSKAAKYIIEQIEEFDSKIIDIKTRLENLNESKEITKLERNNIDIVLKLIKDFSNNVDKLGFEEKKKLLNQIIDEIWWDGEKLGINIVGYNRGR